MIIDEKVKLGYDCYLVANYIDGMKPDVAIDYVEHSFDHLHCDTDTTHTIDRAKAEEIIKFLSRHFKS